MQILYLQQIQTGILNLFDGTTEVFTVKDGGGLTLSSTIDVTGQSTFRDRLQIIDTAPEILLSKPSGGLDSRILNDGSGNLIIGNGTNSDTPTERARIASDGKVGINESNPRHHLTVNSGTTNVAIAVSSTDTGSYIAYQDNTTGDSGTNSEVFAGANGGSFVIHTDASTIPRVAVTNGGKIGVNTTSALNAGAMTLYSANVGEGTATGQLELKDNAAYGSTPTGGIIFSGHHTAGSQAIFAGIRGFKATTGDGNYSGSLGFDVRKHGAVAYEAMRIDEDGRVGIGTIPVAGEGTELAIRSSDGQTNVGLIPNTNSESSQLTFYNASNDSAQGYIRYDNSNNSLQVRVNLAERLRIDNAGDIFIGTTSDIAPANGTNLCVSDATISRLILEKQSTIKFGLNVSNAFTIYDETNDAARFTIDSGGRLYTGASTQLLDSTAGTIHIDGGTSGGRIALRGTTTSAGGGIGEIFAFWNNNKVAGIIALAGADASNKDDGHLTFYTRPDSATGVQERLRIDSVGRLLVGTTTAMTTASNDHRDTIQAVDTSGAQLLLARNDTSTSVTNRLGEIAALTNDSGGAGYKVGASIRFEVSATQSSGDYPTAICFKTCTDGSDSLLERIRVNHDGNLLFTSSQIQKINDTSSIVLSGGDNSNVGGNISLYGSNHSSAQNIIRFRNSASEAMRINGDGDISVNRADNTSSNSILHISSHDVTTKYNNDNVAQVALLIDTHHSGTEALTSNRSKIGIRMDMEYSGTGTKTNTSGARNQLYGIHCSVDSTKDTYTSYGGYFYSNCVADNQAYSTISYGVYGYGRNYSIGGSNRSSTIAGGYFLGYRGGDINAGHCYGVYARAHNVNNTGDNTGDLTGVYAEAEMDKDATVNNAYAFRGYLDRDAGTITNSFILYGSHGGDSHFSNRWGIHISDSAKNYLGGNLTITGTFEKGTDNFRIPHPLVGLTTTKDLVHSVIEGPQMDLIYRGKVDLVGGTATINIDTKAGMTEGTFVVLCKDIQCFTSNETGWTAVKGSVTGNKITIIAQDNSCTDTISWMVVGERQDDNAKSSTCTDNDGNLIVEPDKRTDIIDKYQAESEKNEYNEDPD